MSCRSKRMGLTPNPVFLGAVDGDLDDPGSIRPLPIV